MLKIYLITVSALILGQMSPGPSFIAVAGAALGQGRRSAFYVACGIASATLAWVLGAALGLGALLDAYPWTIVAMKWLGGGYLLFLALRSIRSALRGGEPPIKSSGPSWTPASAWKHGFLVNITNPKAALVWSGIASFLFGSGLSTSEVAGFAPVGFASAMVVFGTYGILFSSGFARRSYARLARIFEALFGLAFGLIGGKLLADGVGSTLR